MGVFKQSDLERAFHQDWTGVQSFLHRHHSNAGLIITFENGPLNRASSAPSGQERSMAVPAPHGGLLQHFGWKKLPEGNHHREVSIEIGKLLLTGMIPSDFFRSENLQIEFKSSSFHC